MDRDEEPVADGRLVDRVVCRVAERPLGHLREQDLDDPGMSAEPVDLPRRRAGILERDLERAAQAVVPLQPRLDQPVVVRASERGGELGLRQRRDAVDVPGQDRVVD